MQNWVEYNFRANELFQHTHTHQTHYNLQRRTIYKDLHKTL